jgi:hypothetical protein
MNGQPEKEIPSSRILPISTNPREGWKASLRGQMPEALRKLIEDPKRVRKSVIMSSAGYHISVSDTVTNDVAVYDVDQFYSSRIITTSVSGSVQDAFPEDDAIAGAGAVLGNDIPKQLPSLAGNSESQYSDDFEDLDENEDRDGDASSFKYQVDGQWAEEEEEEREGDVLSERSVSMGEGSILGTPSISTRQKSQLARTPDEATDQDRSISSNNALGQSSFEDSHLNTTISTLNKGGDRARSANDDVILDLKEVTEHVGQFNKRHIHSLNLRSAYEAYSLAGEPYYTVSNPDPSDDHGVCCMDYIFYSGHTLRPTKILAIPLLHRLQGEDPNEPIATADPYGCEPSTAFSEVFNNHERDLPPLFGKKADVDRMKSRLKSILDISCHQDSRRFWGGQWPVVATPNLKKNNFWLPNECFVSSHISLSAHFQINEDLTSTKWI